MIKTLLCGLCFLASGITSLLSADSPPRFRIDHIPAYTPGDVADSPQGKEFANLFERGQIKAAVKVAEAAIAAQQPVGHFLLGYLAEHPADRAARDLLNAEKHYRDGVKKDHLPASVNLAALLLRQNPRSDEAAILLNAAADRDPKIAGFFLGIASLSGANGTPNVTHTVHLWTQSGEAGHAIAWRHLGFLHQGVFGFSPEVSDAKAFSAFEKAAGLGDAESAVRLAVVILESGDKIGHKAEEAEAWFGKAGSSNEPSALYLLGQVREQGVKTMAANPQAARQIYQQAAALKHAPSMVKLGHLLEFGIGGDTSLEQAVVWYRKAMDLGDGEACYKLALLARQGKGLAVSEAEAFKLFLQAGIREFAPAATEIGDAYRFGTGITPDPFAAVTWLSRAVEAGDPDAMVSLSEMMLSSQGIPYNASLLGQLTQRAFTVGNPRAGLLLARMAERGIGDEKNLPKALALYRWAAEKKMTEAVEAAEALQKNFTAEQLQAADQIRQELSAGRSR